MRLEQIGLAGAVRTEHDGQPVAELGLRALVVAEVAQPDALRLRAPSASDVEADRHHQIDEAAVVAGLDQARAGAG